jgi:RNA polymerase sigma-70 factor (ECF subfamily)
MNDAALSRLFLRFRDRHNGKALAAVFDATARELIEVAAHLVRDADEAEDLVQTTFRVAIERAGAFDRDRSLRAWLYGILAKEAAKSRRQAARRVDAAALGERAEANPLDAMIADEVPTVLRAAVERLPAPYREVVDPVVCGGRSTRDVARELGRAPGTVRVQVQRGLEKLRRALPDDYRPTGFVLLSAGGLARMRSTVMRAAGHSSVAAGAGVWIAAEAALAVLSVAPALWVAPALALAVGTTWLAREGALSTVSPAREDSESSLAAVGLEGMLVETVPGRRPAEDGGQDRIPVRASSEHATEPQLLGTVLDEREQPVAGVVVRGRRDDSEGYPASFVTDAAGRFSFERLEQGWWFFSVDDPRYAIVWWRKFGALLPEQGDEPTDVRLRLYDPRSVAGRVVDEAGVPVPGVHLTLAVEWVEGEEDPVQGHLTHTVQATESDEEGHFELSRLSPGELRMVLDHPDFARTVTSFRTDDADVRLVLERGSTLAGRVLAGAEPLAGVRVRAVAPHRSKLSMVDRSALTDAEGRFRITRIHSFHDVVEHGVPTVIASVADERWVSAAYRIHEWDPGRLPGVTIEALPVGSTPDPKQVDVGKDAAREAAALGEPFGDATLRVRFATGTAVAADAETNLWVAGRSPELEGFYRNERVELRGGFDFEGLSPGRYRVWTLNSGEPNFQPAVVDVRAGETLDVVLSPGGIVLSGSITSGGQPVSDVSVFCTGAMRAAGDVRGDGTYEVTGLVPGTYELLVYSETSFDSYHTVEVPGDGTGTHPFDIRLPMGVVTGLVRGVEFNRDERKIQVFPRGWGTASGNRGNRAPVDVRGRFRMRFLPEGDYKVFLWNSAPRVLPASVRITPAQSAHDVVLEPPVHTTEVRGRVTNPVDGGRLGTGTSLLLVHRDSEGYAFGSYGGYATVDGETGEFTLDDVAPGAYGLHVTHYDVDAPFLWIPDFVVPPDGVEGLTITIPAGRQVSVVLDAGDLSTPQSLWFLRMPSGERLPYYCFVGSGSRGLRASSQAFGLPYGEYTVEGDFGAGRIVTRSLTVGPGEGGLEVVLSLE